MATTNSHETGNGVGGHQPEMPYCILWDGAAAKVGASAAMEPVAAAVTEPVAAAEAGMAAPLAAGGVGVWVRGSLWGDHLLQVIWQAENIFAMGLLAGS